MVEQGLAILLVIGSLVYAPFKCRFHRDRQPPRQYATAEPKPPIGPIQE